MRARPELLKDNSRYTKTIRQGREVRDDTMDWALLGQAGLDTLRPPNTPLSAAKRSNFLSIILHITSKMDQGAKDRRERIKEKRRD